MAKIRTIAQIQNVDINSKEFVDNFDENLEVMIKKFNARSRSFSNVKNKNVFSYALDKMEDWLDHNTYAKAARGQLKIPNSTNDGRRDYTRKQVLAFKIQEFFRSETSSVKGARQVARDQDARLFGVDARGNPLIRMNYKERKKFWEVYDEFLNQNKQWSEKSYRAQEVISSMVRDGSITRGDLQTVLNEARRRYQDGFDEEDVSPWHGEKATESVTKRYGDTVLKRGRHGR